LDVERANIGSKRPGEAVAVDVRIHNGSEDVLDLVDQLSSPWHGLRAVGLPVSIRAGATSSVRIEGLVPQHLGKQRFNIDLLRRDGSRFRVPVTGFVYSLLDPVPAKIELVTVVRDVAESSVFAFSSKEVAQFKLSNPVDQTGEVVADVLSDGHTLRLAPIADGTWGIRSGWVVAGTDIPRQPEAWLAYEFERRGIVVPNSYVHDLGVVRKGTGFRHHILLKDTDQARLRIGTVEQRGSELDVQVVRCPEVRRYCRALEVRVPDTTPSGQFLTSLKVRLPRYGRDLMLEVRGVLLAVDQQIVDIDSTRVDGDDTNVDAGTAAMAALRQITTSNPIEMADPEGDGPLLQWRVANVASLTGYVVVRADTEAGPYSSVNEELIPALANPENRPVHYRWRDTTAAPNRGYWYQVLAVTTDARRIELTPVIRYDTDK
jgi:hypothetical protein